MTLPEPRGRLTPGRTLGDLTWLRVGGPADALFQPADAEDLQSFLAALDPDVPVFPMGVGSNLIVRDGGCGRWLSALAGDSTPFEPKVGG